MTAQHDSDRTIGVVSPEAGSNSWTARSISACYALGMAPMTNKNGGSVVTGDVLIQDTATASALVQTTTAGDLRPVYIVPSEIQRDQDGGAQIDLTIVNNDTDFFYAPGAPRVPKINCDTAAVAIGEYLKTSSTAKKATGTGVTVGASTAPPVGSFAIALTSKAGGSNGQVEGLMLAGTAGGIGGRAVSSSAPKDGDVVAWDAANSTFSPMGGVREDIPYLSQANSAAEITALTKTIRGNTVGSKGLVRGRIALRCFNNTAANRNYTVTVKFGGTTILAAVTAIPFHATNYVLTYVEFAMRSSGATNSQVWYFTLPSVPTGGPPDSFVAMSQFGTFDTSALDTTVNQDLVITITMATASANESWEITDGWIEGPFLSN